MDFCVQRCGTTSDVSDHPDWGENAVRRSLAAEVGRCGGGAIDTFLKVPRRELGRSDSTWR